MKKTLLFNQKDISLLEIELVNFQKELFNLRIQKIMNPELQNNNLLKEARRNIARINTFITLKKKSELK
ncbi:MAG: 50S ribosomal protein L29 [Candidatus Dasytiphilus stammeri]